MRKCQGCAPTRTSSSKDNATEEDKRINISGSRTKISKKKPRRPAQVVNEQTRVITLLKGLQGRTRDTGVRNIFQKVIETAETYLRPW